MRIYVGNLPREVTEQELRALFSVHGRIETLMLRTLAPNPAPIAFVEMPNGNEAQAAVRALHDRLFKERNLIVIEVSPSRAPTGPEWEHVTERPVRGT